jgi:glycosyltransferase involved in cell wall biosynthesis
MNKNLVSIIMNCHNGDKYLIEAVNSIFKQTYKNWELIFFDNASKDNSAKIIKNFRDKRIKYYYSKYMKLGTARKRALNLCKGEFISFLDCDDYWASNKLQLQIQELKKNPEVGVSFSNSYFFKNNKKKLLYKQSPPDGYIFKSLLKRYNISFDTVIIKKLYLNKLNQKFDERFNIIHDLDLLIRLSMITKFKYLHKNLSWWRIHENSFSQNKISVVNEEKRIFLNKLKKILKTQKNKKKYIDLFKINLNQSLIEEYIVSNNIRKFFKLFLETKKFKIKDLILFCVAIFPGGSQIYKKFKKSW